MSEINVYERIQTYIQENKNDSELKGKTESEVVSIMLARGVLSEVEYKTYKQASIFLSQTHYWDNIDVFQRNNKPQTDIGIYENYALNRLNQNIDEATQIVEEREKEGGFFSWLVNQGHEAAANPTHSLFTEIFFNGENAKSTIENTILESQKDFEYLQQIAQGEEVRSDYVRTNPITFAEAWKERRGVEFDENALRTCEEKSQVMAQINLTVNTLNSVKSQLRKAGGAGLNQNTRPDVVGATLLQAFKLAGITKISDINKVISDIETNFKDHPNIKKYGGDLKIEKDTNGKWVLKCTTPAGNRTHATAPQISLITEELCKRLNLTIAEGLGLEFDETTPSQELEEKISQKVSEVNSDYEASFAEAYGEKDLKLLAQRYVEKQEQGVANIQMALNIASMAIMLTPGVLGAGGWLLQGTSAAAKMAQLAAAAQKITQVLSPLAMVNMTLSPVELLEQMTSENGMTEEEWKLWGQGVLESSTYMAVGMGVGKIAEVGAAMYKMRALVTTLKEGGKSVDEIMALIKANPVKFPPEIVQSLKTTDTIAKTFQVGTEFALDIGTTVALNKAMGQEGFQVMDVASSIMFAISGTVFQKQFMSLSTESKKMFLQDAFKDFGITRTDAERILKAMDDISAGKIDGGEDLSAAKATNSTSEQTVEKSTGRVENNLKSNQSNAVDSKLINEKLEKIVDFQDFYNQRADFNKDFSNVQLEILNRVFNESGNSTTDEKFVAFKKMLTIKDLSEECIIKLLVSEKVDVKELVDIERYFNIARENDFDIVKLMESKEKDFNKYIKEEQDRINSGLAKTEEFSNKIVVVDNWQALYEQLKGKLYSDATAELKKLTKEQVTELSMFLSHVEEIDKLEGSYIKTIVSLCERYSNDKDILYACSELGWSASDINDLLEVTIANNPLKKKAVLETLELKKQEKILLKLDPSINYYKGSHVLYGNLWENIVKKIDTPEQLEVYNYYIRNASVDDLRRSSIYDMTLLRDVDDMKDWMKFARLGSLASDKDFNNLFFLMSKEDRALFTTAHTRGRYFTDYKAIIQKLIAPDIEESVKNNIRELIKLNPDDDLLWKWNCCNESKEGFNLSDLERILKFEKALGEASKMGYEKLTSRLSDGNYEYSDAEIDSWLSVINDESIKEKLGRTLTISEAREFCPVIDISWKKDYILSKLNPDCNYSQLLKGMYLLDTEDQLSLFDVLNVRDGYNTYFEIPLEGKQPIKLDNCIFKDLKDPDVIEAFCIFAKSLSKQEDTSLASSIISYFEVYKPGSVSIKLILELYGATPNLLKAMTDRDSYFLGNIKNEYQVDVLKQLDKLLEKYPKYKDKLESLIKRKDSFGYVSSSGKNFFDKITSSDDLKKVKKNINTLMEFGEDAISMIPNGFSVEDRELDAILLSNHLTLEKLNAVNELEISAYDKANLLASDIDAETLSKVIEKFSDKETLEQDRYTLSLCKAFTIENQEFYKKILVDPFFEGCNSKDYYYIFASGREHDFKAMLEFYEDLRSSKSFDKDHNLSKKDILDIIRKVNSNNIKLAKSLCIDELNFPKDKIAEILSRTNQYNLTLAEEFFLDEYKKFSFDQKIKILECSANAKFQDVEEYLHDVYHGVECGCSIEIACAYAQYGSILNNMEIREKIMKHSKMLKQHGIESDEKAIDKMLTTRESTANGLFDGGFEAYGLDGIKELLKITDMVTIENATQLKFTGFKNFLLYGSLLSRLSPENRAKLKEVLAKFPYPEQKVQKIQIVSSLIGNVSDADLTALINRIESPNVTAEQKSSVERIFSPENKKTYSEKIEDFIIEFNVPASKVDNIRSWLISAKLDAKFIEPKSIEEQISNIDSKIEINERIINSGKVSDEEKLKKLIASTEGLKAQKADMLANPEKYTKIQLNNKSMQEVENKIRDNINYPNQTKAFIEDACKLLYAKMGMQNLPEGLLDAIDYDFKYFARLFAGLDNPGWHSSSGFTFNTEFTKLINLLIENPGKKLTEARMSIPENQRTKEMFKENGLDFEFWNKFDDNFKHSFSTLIKKDQAVAEVLNNLKNELETDLFKSFDEKEQELLLDKIKKALEAIPKTDDPVENNLHEANTILNVIENELKENEYWKQNAGMFSDHIKDHRKKVHDAKDIKDREVSLFVRLSDSDDIGRNIFFGDHVGCCTSCGGGNGFAAPQHLQNAFVRGYELVDENGISYGNSMCFFAKVDGKLTFVIDSFEANGQLAASKEVPDALIAFAHMVCEREGRPDAQIMFGPNYNHIASNRFKETSDHSIEMVGAAPCDTYIDSMGGFGDINEPYKTSMLEIIE